MTPAEVAAAIEALVSGQDKPRIALYTETLRNWLTALSPQPVPLPEGEGWWWEWDSLSDKWHENPRKIIGRRSEFESFTTWLHDGPAFPPECKEGQWLRIPSPPIPTEPAAEGAKPVFISRFFDPINRVTPVPFDAEPLEAPSTLREPGAPGDGLCQICHQPEDSTAHTWHHKFTTPATIAADEACSPAL